jgi:hypothetical protein
MQEFDRKEQERISSLPQIDRYLVDSEYHVLRSFDGRPVMKEKTVPVIMILMITGCLASIAIAFFAEGTQRILMFAAAAFFAFYGLRYYQYMQALKGK